MPPATATSSPRDDYVDSNPDLARKKQRLSEDQDEDSAAEDAILIEACEPEDIGASLDTAIQIEDDENTMLPYSESFWLQRQEPRPHEQVFNLAKEIASGRYYLRVDEFQALAESLTQHCTTTRDHTPDEWRRQYFDVDAEFFSTLCHLSFAVLSTWNLFERKEVENRSIDEAMQEFFASTAELSCRIISLLPETISSSLSRRDSALQGSAVAQPIELFHFLTIALRSIPQNSDMLQHFSRSAHLDTKRVGANNIRMLSRAVVIEALGTTVKMLGGAMRQIKDSWVMLQEVLRLLGIILRHKQYETFPNSVLEEVMEIVKACVLPAVCAKHPGALPDGFHDELIQFGHLCILESAQSSSHDSASQFYSRFVKSDEDAILHEGLPANMVANQLTDVSGGDYAILAQLLAESWAMQASIAYVRSDIIIIRNLGLTTLTRHLQHAFRFAKGAEKFDHIFIQHAVRFLRKNEITKYIFSSDSHASLVLESSLIISFLASTATYTDQETDVIWRACSTSVEADFVKASFGVLHNQLGSLDFGHVLYIFKKYATTPMEGMGAASAEFLPFVMQRLDQFHGPTLDQVNRLDLAFTTIDILKHVDASNTDANSDKLRTYLHTGIGKFTSKEFTAEDRREIYTRLSPDVAKHSFCGTTAAKIITIMLQTQPPEDEIQTILSMLPVNAAVEDLQSFVVSLTGQPESHPIIISIVIRLNYILRIMSIDTDTPSDDANRKVFESVFGEAALGEAARSAAWDKLHALTAMKDSPRAAINLWRMYMQRYVPSLPTALASSKLVELMCTYLMEECNTGSMKADYSQLLHHPLWATLKRFATTSRDRHVINLATSTIAYFLINYPAHPNTPDLRDHAVKCQRETVGELVDRLRQSYDQLRGDSAEREQDVLQTIDLLHSLLYRSREFAPFYAPANKHDLVVLEPCDEANQLSFTMQVYGAEPQFQTLSVQAAKTTTISQLLSRLPSETGAAANRIIVAGREITALTTHTLVEAGLQNSGVIQIRPRYKHDFDFDHLLRSVGPLEREIVARFDSLESLTDGATSIAETAVNFLRSVPPTHEARLKVISPSALATELFPQHRPARAQFSIYVLDRHLRDCTQISIADTAFLSRGARVLASVLMDETRPLFEPITPEVLRCLHAFLQERPASDNPATLFEDGPLFSSRMMDRLFEIERTAYTDLATMKTAASGAYGILLLASQIDSSVWQDFSTSERSAELHARLLLHPDASFSGDISRSIESLCQSSETPKTVSDFFWQTIMACLPEALKTSTQCHNFFKLAPEILHATDLIQRNETNARSLVEYLSTALWSYRHTESANDLLRDDAMAGLLKLLGAAVTILRSFKKRLHLDGLSSRIAEQLLFPDDTDANSRPIVHEDTRSCAYDLMRHSLESAADFERVVRVTECMTERSVRIPHSTFPGPSIWQRQPIECSGLSNLGMTCYMNSMLQQLYGNIQFRKFVLDLPMLFPEKQMLSREMQNLFAKMQNSTEPCQDTNPLAQVLGVQIGNQEDVHDFYASLLGKLEDEMPDSDTKLALSKFFTGQSITQIRGECGHVSSQKEAFGELSVTVKNKPNLHDSLAEFVQGEPMEGSNKYKCMSCDPENGRLVDAMRRTCLEDVPDCLTVCLKRFTIGSKFLGEGKVNDRFDFPETIDMSMYKRSHLEAPEQSHELDIFQLVGVVVHQGSLNLGHYWSYVRVPNAMVPGAGDWFYLEDNRTSYCPTGIDVIQQECFGGQRHSNGNERPDNAYVLFYQRRQYSVDAPLACESAGPMPNTSIGLPKVPLRQPLASEVDGMNRWRQRIADLFDPKFPNHVCWLLNQYPCFKEAKADASDSDANPDTSERSEQSPSITLDSTVGALMGHHVLRILLSDPLCEDKLSQTISAFQTALAACPALAQHILNVFSSDSFGLETVLLSDHPKVRTAVFELLTGCVYVLREQNSEAYWKEVDRILRVAASMRTSGWVEKHPLTWSEYFTFLSSIAKQGPKETKKVLDGEYIDWIIAIVWMSRSPNLQQSHQHLWNRLSHGDSSVDFDSLFHFLYDILSEYVDLSDLDSNAAASGSRTETARGWSLTSSERTWLLRLEDQKGHPLWQFYVLSRPRCRGDRQNWKNFGLGKFLGLMVSDKADPAFKSSVIESLAYDYDKEGHHLTPLLYVTLHYCANNDDSECNRVLRLLTDTLPMWPEDRKSIDFLREAFVLAPCSVVDSALLWAHKFLCSKKAWFRQASAEWLNTHIFVEQALSDDHVLDVCRAKVARSLATSLGNDVKHAYNQEEAKNGWEPAMEVLQAIATYISTLASAVEQAQHDGLTLPAGLLAENDEARALLPNLGAFLDELEDWETEAALPMRHFNVRHSVEIDETDGSDEEEEFEDFEDLSNSM